MMSSPITIVRGEEEATRRLARSAGFAVTDLPERLLARNQEIFGQRLSAEQVVERVISDVRADGDAALRRYSEAFDGQDVADFEVPRGQWQQAFEALEPTLQRALQTAASRIEAFHRRQPGQSWIETEPLGIFGQVIRPLERVGVYSPGGTAALPSSLLMVAIPARVAGVEEIIVCSPPRHDGDVEPVILGAALVAGVDRVFRVGGAQAIAAMAYGTESVPAVDKVVGPGNIFVALAKKHVFGDVDIDQIAGPTETMIIADGSADVEFVAADMLAQAEHDEQASAILLTPSSAFADAVADELAHQLITLDRQHVARASLAANGLIAVVDTIKVAIDLANRYAPEHLCLLVNDPWSLIPAIRNAAGIFIGENSPEALGDYAAGPSHVMPTGGTARHSSPVNVGDFQKVVSIVAAGPEALPALGDTVVELARAEGLTAHAAAITRRLDRRPS